MPQRIGANRTIPAGADKMSVRRAANPTENENLANIFASGSQRPAGPAVIAAGRSFGARAAGACDYLQINSAADNEFEMTLGPPVCALKPNTRI
jgi:hypothetical protein